jgi:hypothetical protein
LPIASPLIVAASAAASETRSPMIVVHASDRSAKRAKTQREMTRNPQPTRDRLSRMLSRPTLPHLPDQQQHAEDRQHDASGRSARARHAR